MYSLNVSLVYAIPGSYNSLVVCNTGELQLPGACNTGDETTLCMKHQAGYRYATPGIFLYMYFLQYWKCSSKCMRHPDFYAGRYVITKYDFSRGPCENCEYHCSDVFSMFVLSKWQFWRLFGTPCALMRLGARIFYWYLLYVTKNQTNFMRLSL